MVDVKILYSFTNASESSCVVASSPYLIQINLTEAVVNQAKRGLARSSRPFHLSLFPSAATMRADV